MSKVIWSIPSWRRAAALNIMILESVLKADAQKKHEVHVHLCLKDAPKKSIESYDPIIDLIAASGLTIHVDRITNHGWDFVSYSRTCQQFPNFDYYIFALDDAYIAGDDWLNKWVDSDHSKNPLAILANCDPTIPQPGMEEFPELTKCLFPMVLTPHLLGEIWNWDIPYDSAITDWRVNEGPGSKGWTCVEIERPFKVSMAEFQRRTKSKLVMVPPHELGLEVLPHNQVCDQYDDPRINSQRPLFAHRDFYDDEFYESEINKPRE